MFKPIYMLLALVIFDCSSPPTNPPPNPASQTQSSPPDLKVSLTSPAAAVVTTELEPAGDHQLQAIAVAGGQSFKSAAAIYVRVPNE